MNKSLTFDHFWPPFGPLDPLWEGSGSQRETKRILETTFIILLMDFGNPRAPHWGPLLEKLEKTTSKTLFSRILQEVFKKHRNFNDFGISELIGNLNDSNCALHLILSFSHSLNCPKDIDFIMKSDASRALGALSSEMLPRASI